MIFFHGIVFNLPLREITSSHAEAESPVGREAGESQYVTDFKKSQQNQHCLKDASHRVST